MLDFLEKQLEKLRRLKFYVTIAATLLPAIGLFLLILAQKLVLFLSNIANNIASKIGQNAILGIVIFIVFGIGALKFIAKAKIDFKLPKIFMYYIVGILFFIIIFSLLPSLFLAFAYSIQPYIDMLANYFRGEARLTLSIIIRYVFYVFLFTFFIDLLIQKRNKNNIYSAIITLIKKEWSDLFDCLVEVYHLIGHIFFRHN